MTPKDFTDGVYEELDRSLEDSKQAFLNLELEELRDSYYTKAILFFRSLDQEQQEVFFEVIKQIQIDTTATIFALIDGVFYLQNQENDFKLIYQSQPEKVISGDLKDIFLERIEIEEAGKNL